MDRNSDTNDPTWTIPKILQRAFADEQVAQWLLSTDTQPPTMISPDMMKYSLTGEVSIMHSSEPEAYIYRKNNVNERTSSSTGPNPHGPATHSLERALPRSSFHPGEREQGKEEAVSPVPKLNLVRDIVSPFPSLPVALSSPEKLVFICHGGTENRAFLTMTDSRTPFAFLECPSEAVPGVRRVIVETSDKDLFVSMFYWLENGRSCLTCMRFWFDSSHRTRRCSMLFAPFPWVRYPLPSDVMESVMVSESPDCQFCIFRGYPRCECTRRSLERQRPTLPTEQRDPWSLWSWVFMNREAGLKKDLIVLRNYTKNVQVNTTFFYQINPTLGHTQLAHVQGYQYYLYCVASCWQDRMLSWRFPNNLRHLPSTGDDSSSLHDRLLRLGNEALDIPCQNQVDVFPNNQLVPPPLHTNSVMDGSVLDELQGLRETDYSGVIIEDLLDENPEGRQNPLEPAGKSEDTIAKSSKRARTESGSASTVGQPNAKRHAAENPTHVKVQTSQEEHFSENDPGASGSGAPANEEEADLDPQAKEEALKYLEEIDQLSLPHDAKCTCKFCGRLFTRKYDLKRHVKASHLTDRKFACSSCGFKFKRQEHLDWHINQVHEKKFEFKCHYCGKLLLSESNRRRHIKQVHHKDFRQTTDEE